MKSPSSHIPPRLTSLPLNRPSPVPWQKMRRGLSSTPLKDLSPSGLCDLSLALPPSFDFNFNALRWHHTRTILAKHQKLLSPSAPLLLFPLPFNLPLWISLTFDVWNVLLFQFQWAELPLYPSLWRKLPQPPPHPDFLPLCLPEDRLKKNYLFISVLLFFFCFVLDFFLTSLSLSLLQFSISMCFQVSESHSQWSNRFEVCMPQEPRSHPLRVNSELFKFPQTKLNQRLFFY